jgi:hypothetical protein
MFDEAEVLVAVIMSLSLILFFFVLIKRKFKSAGFVPYPLRCFVQIFVLQVLIRGC